MQPFVFLILKSLIFPDFIRERCLRVPLNQRLRHRSDASTSTVNQVHHKHQYQVIHSLQVNCSEQNFDVAITGFQVDCAKAHKGLFCGILLLVVCIISLILFFVLIKKPNYRHIGVLQAHIVELLVYVINAIACIIAAFQVTRMWFHKESSLARGSLVPVIPCLTSEFLFGCRSANYAIAGIGT